MQKSTLKTRYNYNSSEWFQQSYKILNKDYEIENISKKQIKEKIKA